MYAEIKIMFTDIYSVCVCVCGFYVIICLIFRHIMKAKFVHPSDLQPGVFVSCKIKEHVQNGAFVIINGGGKSLTGFVQSLHLGNVPLQHPPPPPKKKSFQ